MFARSALISMLLVALNAGAAPAGIIPDVDIVTKQEKTDAVLTFERAAVAGVVSEEKADGLVGVTADFAGGKLPVFIAFDASVSEDTLFPLMNFQSRIHGSVQCKRIRVGNSRTHSKGGTAVVAEQCAIKSIKH